MKVKKASTTKSDTNKNSSSAAKKQRAMQKSGPSRVVKKISSEPSYAHTKAAKSQFKMKQHSNRSITEYYGKQFDEHGDNNSKGQRRTNKKFELPGSRQILTAKRSEGTQEQSESVGYASLSNRVHEKSDEYEIKKSWNMSTYSKGCSGNYEIDNSMNSEEPMIERIEQEYLDSLSKAAKSDWK